MKCVYEPKTKTWWQIIGSKAKAILFESERPVDPNLPVFEVDDLTSLDWSCLLERDCSTGLIAPDGTWFGCWQSRINDLITLFFMTTQEELENNGWVIITRDPNTKKREWYSKGMRVTIKQANTLTHKGFVPEKWQVKKENFDE